MEWVEKNVRSDMRQARVKGKVYRVAVRPAMLYGLETVALTKRQETEKDVAELKVLRYSLRVTIMDQIRNDNIRGTAQVGRFGGKTREARLRWYGHVQRKYDGYIGRRMLRMELPGKRKRGRPKRRFMDVVKEDIIIIIIRQPLCPVVGRRPQHVVCRLQMNLSCAVLCHIVSLQYLSRSSLHRLAGLP